MAKVRRENTKKKEARIQQLERFLGVSRDDFESDDQRSYFNWWLDPPRLVFHEEPKHFGELIQIIDKGMMSAESFWKFVKSTSWPSLMDREGGIKNAGEKLSQKLRDPIDLTGFLNTYDVFYNTLSLALNSYVVGSLGDSPGTGDDSTWDLLSHCIGKGQSFYTKCMKDPSIMIKIAKDSDYYESFAYVMGPLYDRLDSEDLHDLRIKPARLSMKERGVPVYPGLVRYFQTTTQNIFVE